MLKPEDCQIDKMVYEEGFNLYQIKSLPDEQGYLNVLRLKSTDIERLNIKDLFDYNEEKIGEVAK